MVPSQKASPPSLENGASRMFLDDLVYVPVLDPTNQPWKYVTCRGSRKQRPLATGASLEMLKPRPNTDQKQLCRPGSRGSGAFVLGGFPIKIGYRGTCVFILGSVSLSGGFYLGFRSSELSPSSDREAVQDSGQFTIHGGYYSWLGSIWPHRPSVLEAFLIPLEVKQRLDLLSHWTSCHHWQFYGKKHHGSWGKNPVLS